MPTTCYTSAPVDSLIPYVNNARTHTDEQVAQIAASIREFGFTNPVLITPDNTLIAGHGRLSAARKLGLTEIPAITVEGLSEAQRKALVIADNSLALNAGWNEEVLSAEIDALEELDFDIELLGLDDYSELEDFTSADLDESAFKDEMTLQLKYDAADYESVTSALRRHGDDMAASLKAVLQL